MQRVLFYDDTPDFGGHQVTACAAARQLARQGVDVIAAFSAANARLHTAWSRVDARLEPLDLRLTRWQPFLSPFGIAAAPVRALLERVRPDVVVAVQGTIVQANRVVEQARRLRIPVAGFIPTPLLFPPHQRLFALVGRMLSRWHYRRPDAFLTTSETARRGLVSDDGVRVPVHVVYYGPDPAALHAVPRAEARRRLGIPDDRFVIALIGRLTMGTKGHDLLLRAAARIQSGIPRLCVLFVGDGPDATRIDTLLTDLGLTNIVRRLPWLDDMTDVYSGVDLVAIPSRHEGFPLVALEAMGYGLRIVAATVGALPEVLPAEWLFPPGDVDALTAALLRAYRDDARATIERNRERVLHELNEEAFGRAFLEALLRVAAASR
ncbi:MAG TPA: glycosyltransferase family 4 protein [Thermoanaerobaculia bacterium]|nr:glycosyltransferase family 4 protein [Thermoanaerobaculia bacterium]